MTETGSHPKPPTKKAKRVSPRKELAVVTFAAVASIAGVGGLLSLHQPASQVTPPTHNVVATSWTSPGHTSRPTVSHTVTQGSKAVVGTSQPTGQPAPHAGTASWSSSTQGHHSTVTQGSPTIGQDS